MDCGGVAASVLHPTKHRLLKIPPWLTDLMMHASHQKAMQCESLKRRLDYQLRPRT